MKKTVLFTIMLGAVLFFNACTSPICITSSITPMQGKVITENLGKTNGTDSAFSFLGLYMIGRPDLDRAIDKALEQKGGDTLINVRCYETVSYFVLFSITTVKVEGEAVKFTVDAVESTDKKNDAKKDKKK